MLRLVVPYLPKCMSVMVGTIVCLFEQESTQMSAFERLGRHPDSARHHLRLQIAV